jgi:anti-sigma regulatory factor (Ser/Thr protein kinase)
MPPGPEPLCFREHLPSELTSVAEARRALDRVRSRVTDLTFRDARLLVSELVTNAVRHVPGERAAGVDLLVDVRDGRLRAEVRDRGLGFEPRAREDGPEVPSGWGLHIVDRVASRWGVEQRDGALVWFELDDRPPGG